MSVPNRGSTAFEVDTDELDDGPLPDGLTFDTGTSTWVMLPKGWHEQDGRKGDIIGPGVRLQFHGPHGRWSGPRPLQGRRAPSYFRSLVSAINAWLNEAK